MAKIVNICDVCSEIFAGGDAPKGNMSETKTEEYNIPIYANGEANEGLYGYTNKARVTKPSITVSARGTIGYTAIRPTPFVPIVRLITLTPNPELIDIKYLYYAAQNYKFDGSGTSIPQLTVPSLKKYSFPLPAMEEQAHIVMILDNVCDLIDQKKQQLELLDELVKSRFIELFGDPNTNPMKWKKEQLQINATLLNGRAYKQDELLDDGKYPVLRVGNFFSNRGWYYSDLELDEDKYCDDGDLLYAWSASFGPRIWNGGKVIYHYHIWKVLVGEKYNKQFLCHLLDYATASFMGDTHGIGMMHLTKSGMEETEFIVPLIDLQNQFAAFVKQTDKSKLAVQQSIAELEELKKSLMQKYFG